MDDLKKTIDQLKSSLNGMMAEANFSAEQTKMVHDIMHNGKSAVTLLSEFGEDKSDFNEKLKSIEQMQIKSNEYLNILRNGFDSRR